MTERRTAFRIPVALIEGHSLQVHAFDGQGRSWPGRPVDLSISGMLVAFPKTDSPPFRFGSRLTLTLGLDKTEVSLPAVVNRVVDMGAEQGYGVFFPEVLDKRGLLDPPAEFHRIVNRMEKKWLDQRRG